MKKWENNDRVRPLTPGPSSASDTLYAEIAENNARFASQAIDWVKEAAPGGLGTLSYLVLFRHAIEMLDSIVDKIRNGESTAGQQILRSLFEACISVLYVLEEDSDRRAIAYLYMDASKELKRKRMYDPDSTKYAEHKKLREKDILLKNPPPTPPDTNKINEEWTLLTTHPLMTEAHQEFSRLEDTGKQFQWHTFYDGPSTIYNLAKCVNLGASYEMFYTRYSGAVHPSGIIKPHVKALPDGTGFELTPLRRRKSIADELTALSAEFAGLMFTRFLSKNSSPHIREVEGWLSDFRQSIVEVREQTRNSHSPESK